MEKPYGEKGGLGRRDGQPNKVPDRHTSLTWEHLISIPAETKKQNCPRESQGKGPGKGTSKSGSSTKLNHQVSRDGRGAQGEGDGRSSRWKNSQILQRG